jgi:hypothetical protein
MYRLAKVHCSPGANVLVLGAGAGGDTMGLLMAGCNVFAVENDEPQIDYLQQHFTAVVSNWAEHKAKCDQHLLVVAEVTDGMRMGFKEPERNSQFREFLATQLGIHSDTEEPEIKKKKGATKPADAVVNCSICANPLTNKGSPCMICGMSSHTACMQRCPKKTHLVCIEKCGDVCTGCFPHRQDSDDEDANPPEQELSDLPGVY